MATGLACHAGAGQGSADRPTGALAVRSRGTASADQPVVARRGHPPWQRPDPLRALHERAGQAAMTFTWRRQSSRQPSLAQRPFELLGFTVGVVLVLHASHLAWWL